MNLLDILNEELSSNQKEILPEWISENNSSLKAYRKINKLKLDKLDYIKKHSKVSDYKLKSNYKISNKALIDALQMSRTGLFGEQNSYAGSLKRYLGSTNDELEKKKSGRLKKGGLLAKDKKTVVKKAQSLQQEYDALKNKKLSEFYDDLVNKMPIKDRQKLGLM